jgi:hypothetical protein
MGNKKILGINLSTLKKNRALYFLLLFSDVLVSPLSSIPWAKKVKR